MSDPLVSDLLEVEVDGRPPPAPERGPALHHRSRPAVVLAAAVAATALLVGMLRSPADGDGPVGTAATSQPADSPEQEVLQATAAAMSAWGEFAVTGDVADVAAHFAADGPQYRLLANEARQMEVARPSEPYEVETSGVVESLSAERARVRAAVVWRHAAEAERRWEWFIDLRRAGPRTGWSVWTVGAERQG